MSRRPSFIPAAVLLAACLAVLPACNKKKKDGGGGDSPAPASDGGPPVAAGGDYVFFAHLNVKAVRDSAIYKEIEQAVAKGGAKADWNDLEAKFAKETGGVKPSDVDTVAIWVADIPEGGPAVPRFVAVVESAKAFDKAAVTGAAKARPGADGFYSVGPAENGGLFHFPNDKTLVVLHPDFKQKYLDGYAKNRGGWPMTAELSKAASGHTLYAVLKGDRLPPLVTQAPEAQMAGPLLSAKSVTLTADLKGKELSVAARATFPDAGTAGKAKESVQGFIKMGTGFIDQLMQGKEAAELAGFMPAVKEAQRALREAKVDVSGSDLVVTGSYRANFDVGTMVAEGVKQLRDRGGRMTASNNLKQIGLALHNFASAQQRVPIHGVGKQGMVLNNPKDRPLLSWRVAILPYIEQDNLYRQFKLDEPWDSEHNKKLIEKMPKTFASEIKPGKPGYTHLQMVIGPNAMQPPSLIIHTIPDGTSNTIAVVEAAQPVIWTKPDDVMLTGKEQPNDLKKKFGGVTPGGFNVLMWDGSVRFVRDSIDGKVLGFLLDPKDGNVIPPGGW
jgi:prepilin-type processing-associated H-X9-DG protein